MKGRIPKRKDIERTVMGIIQSTAFLTTSAFSYSMYLCILNKIFGGFNFFTVSYIPAFMSSMTAIIVERPSRRGMLCLYVCNVATETLWRMAEYRNMVKSVKYGQVMIFGVSAAVLTYYFRKGYHLEEKDSVFDILRFVIGKEEEHKAIENREEPERTIPKSRPIGSNNYNLVQQSLAIYQKIIETIKNSPKSIACPHTNGCLYYVLSGGVKLFGIGLIVQVLLKMLFQLKKVFSSPSKIWKLIFNKDTMKIGTFLGGYAFLYRVSPLIQLQKSFFYLKLYIFRALCVHCVT